METLHVWQLSQAYLVGLHRQYWQLLCLKPEILLHVHVQDLLHVPLLNDKEENRIPIVIVTQGDMCSDSPDWLMCLMLNKISTFKILGPNLDIIAQLLY